MLLFQLPRPVPALRSGYVRKVKTGVKSVFPVVICQLDWSYLID